MNYKLKPQLDKQHQTLNTFLLIVSFCRMTVRHFRTARFIKLSANEDWNFAPSFFFLSMMTVIDELSFETEVKPRSSVPRRTSRQLTIARSPHFGRHNRL